MTDEGDFVFHVGDLASTIERPPRAMKLDYRREVLLAEDRAEITLAASAFFHFSLLLLANKVKR